MEKTPLATEKPHSSDSELYRANIKMEMGKLQVSACRTLLHDGLLWGKQI